MAYLSPENWQQIKIYLQTNGNFLSIWVISPLILIFIYIIWVRNNNLFLSLNKVNRTQNNYDKLTVKRDLFFYFYIAFLIIFLGIYIYLIMYGTEFAYHDHEQFTFYSVNGRFFAMPMWGSIGRYWPLGLQEYNLISLFSKTPFAYHLFSVIQLLIIITIIYFIFKPLNISLKLIIIFTIILTPSFVISFFGLIFPERNLIFWLAIFIFCYQQFSKNQSFYYFCGIIFATQFLLYYKEPVFLLIGSFAISRLFLKLVKKQILLFKPQQYLLFIKQNWCDFSLIILVVIFLIQYRIETQDHLESSYANQQAVMNGFSTLISYLEINSIILIFLVVFLVRLSFLVIKRKRPDLIWDCLAIGNLVYFLAYIKLNLFRWYYVAPVDFIAILYFAKLLKPIITHKHKYKVLGITILTTAILCQNIHYSAYIILFRKKSIEARVEVVNFLNHYIANKKDNDDIHLFLPFNGYHAMQFSAFLYYRDFSILSPEKIHNFYIYTPQKYPSNLCVTYSAFKCYYTANLQKIDLVIFLPADNTFYGTKLQQVVIEAEARKLENKLIEIYHYQPQFQSLEKILLFFATNNTIDKNWLNAYIFIPKNH